MNRQKETAVTAKQSPLVSVVVPVYNVQSYLRECLDSLARQTDPDYEVVIIDDGSTDESAQIISEYCGKHAQFWSHHQNNMGLGGARNTGVRISRGDYITFVDSDDYVSDDYVELLRAEQERGDYDMVSGCFERVSERGESLNHQKFPIHKLPATFSNLEPYQILLGSYAPSVCWARLYKRELLTKHPLQFFDKMPHEDLCFTYKAAYFARTLGEIDQCIYYYRQRGGTLSKVATFEHVDGVIEQWRDTEQLLDSINAPDSDYVLAARRTLNLLHGVAKRSQKAPEDVRRYLDIKISSHVEDIRDLLIRIRSLPADDAYDPAPINALIGEPGKQNKETEVSANSIPFSSSGPIFPHEKMNLSSYPKSDQENDPAGDKDELVQLYNKFKGKRCFIIGNGPSLNKHDLALLENEYTFGVNSIFYKTNEMGFRPTFFVVEDSKVMEERVDAIRSYDAPYKFFPSKDRELIGNSTKNTIFYNCDWGFYRKSSPFYCVPRFSVDASSIVYAGQTVTYANMQLAFFMGFTEVYLIGMDFDYVIPKEHERRGNHIISTTDDPNHFHKDYFGKGKTWKDPKLDRVAMSYRQAKLSFEAVGRNIYNATIGGQLEIFDRVDYETLLRDPITSKKRRKAITPSPFARGKVQSDNVRSEERAAIPAAESNQAWHDEAPSRRAPAPVSRKWIKFRRDPKAFFRDSRAPLLRPLHYLFGPPKRKHWEFEAAREARWAAGGRLAFLPASRKALAIERTATQNMAHRSAESFHTKLAELREEVRRREIARSAEIETMLSALQVELSDLIAKKSSKLESAQRETHATRERIEHRLTMLDERMQEHKESTHDELKALRLGIDQRLHVEVSEQISALETTVQSNLTRALEAQEEAQSSVKALRESVEAAKIEATASSKMRKSLERQITEGIDAVTEKYESDRRFSPQVNANKWRVHDRVLSSDDIEHISNNWLRPLGLFLSRSQLGYIAHQIGLAEERCEGRMATTIQAAILRTLAMLSLHQKKIDLLEIGTLFGIGAATLYQASRRAQKEMYLTLVDPLDGYYAQSETDNATGVPVTQQTLTSNLETLNIPKKDYRLVKKMSTDPRAVEAVSDRNYDYVLIDGDHSLEGVASDFDLYAPLVKPGGVLIFDDYDTVDWPAIKIFVDEQVRAKEEDWLWIGGEWRTAIFQRRHRNI